MCVCPSPPVSNHNVSCRTEHLDRLPTLRVNDLPTLPPPTSYTHWIKHHCCYFMCLLSWRGYSFPFQPFTVTGSVCYRRPVSHCLAYQWRFPLPIQTRPSLRLKNDCLYHSFGCILPSFPFVLHKNLFSTVWETPMEWKPTTLHNLLITCSYVASVEFIFL